jgi:hypothetical protein
MSSSEVKVPHSFTQRDGTSVHFHSATILPGCHKYTQGEHVLFSASCKLWKFSSLARFILAVHPKELAFLTLEERTSKTSGKTYVLIPTDESRPGTAKMAALFLALCFWKFLDGRKYEEAQDRKKKYFKVKGKGASPFKNPLLTAY